jgi:glycosyltransferase involved in cell wall biosynthesis
VRVLLVVNDLQPYGSQRVALTLSQALVSLGVRVDLMTLESPRDGELAVPSGVTRHVVRRSGHGARSYAGLVRAVRHALKDSSADVVMSHMMFANVVTLAASRLVPRRNRLPVLVTEHNRPSANLQIERSPQALRALARMLYPHARAVVGVSQAVVLDTVDTFGIDPALAVCILNPVDVEAIRREAAQPLDHRWLNGADAQRTIVCVGAFRRAKGQDVLVRALEQMPDSRAVFVGSGPLLEEVKRLAIRLKVDHRTDFAGYRADARAFMARGSVVAVPSRWEGFGLVAVEAAAVGRPIVGSQVSGLAELVPRYVPGELVPPDDVDALAGALRRAIAADGPAQVADFTPFLPAEVATRYLTAAGVSL